MNKIQIYSVIGLCLVAKLSLAATITNHITGVGPESSPISSYICIQDKNGNVTAALASGQSTDGNKASGNPAYVGGSLRFGGCNTSNTYLGYVGFNVDNNYNNYFVTYKPMDNVHIAYTNPAIDIAGNITGKIEYTSINANFSLVKNPPKMNVNWPFVGINLSGLEFGKVIDPIVIPNLSKEDANSAYSDLAEIQKFISAGMNTIRLPISWGYLQLAGPGVGDINLDYYNSYIKPLLETLTNAHINTVVDLHAYMRYSIFGKEYAGCNAEGGKCPDGTLIIDAKAYKDVWSKLYNLIKSDPKINQDYLLFDLVNEPVDVPNDIVFTIQAEVIKVLRNFGFHGYILVEGNSWSGLHSWTTYHWNSTDGKTSYSNSDLFTRENFQKAGITDLSKIIINVHQYFDADYSGTKNTCLTNLKTTGDKGFNLDVFSDYLQQNKLKAMITEFGSGTDSTTCATALTQFMQYLQTHRVVGNSSDDNSYGFMGFTIWSAGHGWVDYNLRVTPNSYQMDSLKPFLN